MKKLPRAFYQRDDVVSIASELLGKILVTRFDGVLSSGRIVETEAYAGTIDKASHAYGGRLTARTSVMFEEGGRAYVYLCYGIHHLFNVVTNARNIPHAILIRALEPLAGIESMLSRTGKLKLDKELTNGPGKLARAMGLSTLHSGQSLSGKEIYIAEDGFQISRKSIGISPRIGVDYAGEDAKLNYRFFIVGNKWVSRLKM